MSKGIRSWRGGLNVAPTRAPDAGRDRLAGLGRLAGLDVRGHAQAMRLGAAARNNRALGRGALVAVRARGLPPTHVQLEPRRLVRAAGVALAPRLRRARVLGRWRGRRSGAPSSATAARPRTARRHVFASRLAVPTGATQADYWCGHSRTRTPSRSFRMSPSATSSTKSCPPRRRNALSSRDGDVRPRRRHGPHGMSMHMYSCASSDARTSGQPTVECSPFVGVDSRRGYSPRDAAETRAAGGALDPRGTRPAPTSKWVPHCFIWQGAVKFGDRTRRDPSLFQRFLRVQSSTDRGLGGRPRDGPGDASQHTAGSLCK